jgi:hypothetical protein
MEKGGDNFGRTPSVDGTRCDGKYEQNECWWIYMDNSKSDLRLLRRRSTTQTCEGKNTNQVESFEM